MRARRTALTVVTVACACVAGPALASVAGGAANTAAPMTETTPLNTVPRTLTATTPTPTATTVTTPTTQTSTTTTTSVPQLRVCLASVRRTIARRLGVRAASISDHQFLASNGMPQCNYLVAHARRGGPHTRAVVVVNVDNGAQAAWRLMRKVVEADQIFGVPPPGWKPPIGLNGLGPYASWFPTLDQLMVNNVTRRYLFTVSIIWFRAKRAAMIELARTAVVPYRQVRRFAR